MLDSEDQLPIRYRGANVGDFAPMAQADIRVLLDNAPRRRRQTLFAIISELVHNAEKYGGAGGMPSEVEVNNDANGTFVEVSSYGYRSDALKLQALIRSNKFASDEELLDLEKRTMRSTRGTKASGIGILQVLRRSKNSNRGRMLDLNLQPENDLLKVSLRAYVD